MKKALLAIAACMALAGQASAADGVKLYGIADVGFEHFSGINVGTPAAPRSGSINQLGSGSESASRIGIRGNEDLGGGLNVFFTLETGFCAAGMNQAGANSSGYCSADGFMQRQSLIGLHGAFGTIRAGKMYTLSFIDEVALVDPFHWFLTGNYGNMSPLLVFGNGSAAQAADGKPVVPFQFVRLDQSVQYETPNLHGLKLAGAYVFRANPGTAVSSSPSKAMELSAVYHSGPVLLGASYASISQMQNFGAAFSNGAKATNWHVFGGYDFKVADVTGLYQKTSVDGLKGSAKSWLLGASVPLGANTVMASLSQTTNDLWSAQQTKSTQIALGLSHALSKRVDLYTSYSHISNSDGGALAVGDGTAAFLGVANQAASGFNLGMRYRF